MEGESRGMKIPRLNNVTVIVFFVAMVAISAQNVFAASNDAEEKKKQAEEEFKAFIEKAEIPSASTLSFQDCLTGP